MYNTKKVQIYRNPLSLWENFDSIFGDIDLFFESIFPDTSLEVTKKSFEGYPVSNIYVDKEGNVKLEVAVSGFNENELSVSAEDGVLIIKGEHKEKKLDQDKPDTDEDERWKKICGRLKNKSFEKKYKISNRIDVTKAEITLNDGILEIIIPPKEEIKPLKLDIKKSK